MVARTFSFEQSFGFILSDISRLARKEFDRRVRNLNVTRAQWLVLLHLARRPGCTQSDLADAMQMQKITVSQKTPTVGVQGCILGAITDAGELGWEVELVTRTNIWPAKALLLGEGDLIQFPVVIVPILSITLPASDNAFIPAVDFDGDGLITALDAYLYVGNLLAQEELQPQRN
jgi:hypothetical protein